MSISVVWKERIAKMVRWPLVEWLMVRAIVLTVPRRRLGVNLVPLSADGRVLLLHHIFHPHMPWGLPGGWLGRGEAPADCALRELKEETGLTAVLGPPLLIETGINPDHLGIVYLGYVEPGPITLSNEINAADWFRPDALPPLLPFAQRAIETAVAHPIAKPEPKDELTTAEDAESRNLRTLRG
jgi:8-oxo-dGTP diphosphatase